MFTINKAIVAVVLLASVPVVAMEKKMKKEEKKVEKKVTALVGPAILPAEIMNTILDADTSCLGLFLKRQINAFIEKQSGNIDAQSKDDQQYKISGGTMLHYAAFNAHPDLVTFLLELGSDPRCCDIYRRTPLDVAYDTMSLLIKQETTDQIRDTLKRMIRVVRILRQQFKGSPLRLGSPAEKTKRRDNVPTPTDLVLAINDSSVTDPTVLSMLEQYIDAGGEITVNPRDEYEYAIMHHMLQKRLVCVSKLLIMWERSQLRGRSLLSPTTPPLSSNNIVLAFNTLSLQSRGKQSNKNKNDEKKKDKK